MEQPQFGEPEPGGDHKDRACAFGLAPRWGRIAVVHIRPPGEEWRYDLPGGALDAGEDEAQAMVREFGEETGLEVGAGRLLARASQLLVRKGGKRVNNRSAFMLAKVVARRPELKIETDHHLLWLKPETALRRLRHGSHAWAVACWMRGGR